MRCSWCLFFFTKDGPGSNLHIYEDNAGNIWSAFPKEPMRKLIAVEHADLFRFIAEKIVDSIFCAGITVVAIFSCDLRIMIIHNHADTSFGHPRINLFEAVLNHVAMLDHITARPAIDMCKRDLLR